MEATDNLTTSIVNSLCCHEHQNHGILRILYENENFVYTTMQTQN